MESPHCPAARRNRCRFVPCTCRRLSNPWHICNMKTACWECEWHGPLDPQGQHWRPKTEWSTLDIDVGFHPQQPRQSIIQTPFIFNHRICVFLPIDLGSTDPSKLDFCSFLTSGGCLQGMNWGITTHRCPTGWRGRPYCDQFQETSRTHLHT